MRSVPVILFLVCLSVSRAQIASDHRPAAKSFTISVEQPAYAGEPIWVHGIARRGWQNCYRLELQFNGKPVPRWSVKPLFLGGVYTGPRSFIDQSGPDCFPTLVSSPPGDRLPLHVWYQIRQPGLYAVRWVSQRFDAKDRKTISVSSSWATFTVIESTAASRERWLNRLLANPPANADVIRVGYIPSLVAAAPDERALQAIADHLQSSDSYVASTAAEALAYFPETRVKAAIFALILKRGPTDFLAHLVSWNTFELDSNTDQRAQMTRSCFPYLNSADPAKASAAIEMILFNVYGGNHSSPTDPKLIAEADDEVLKAAPKIAAAKLDDPERELVLYMRSMDHSEGHLALMRIAHSNSAASGLAHSALLINRDPDANLR